MKGSERIVFGLVLLAVVLILTTLYTEVKGM